MLRALAAARAMDENVGTVLAERDGEERWVTTRGGYMPGDARAWTCRPGSGTRRS